MNPFNVIIRPLLSEKSTDVRESLNQYAFLVHPEASKQDISSAIEKMWNIKPAQVRTAIRRGKVKRRGSHVSKESNTKKAYVTLPQGSKLPIFEDQ